MNNTILALDMLNASLQIAAKIQELLRQAQVENRNVTDQELQELKAVSDKLEDEIIKS